MSEQVIKVSENAAERIKEIMSKAEDKAIGVRVGDNAFLIITHYQRLLDYIKPDFIHVLSNGKIAKTGGAELGIELEKTGYANIG